MFTQLLQILGFIATYVTVVLYYATGGRSPWMAIVSFFLTVHFVGDYFKGFLKKSDPIVIAGYDLSMMLQPVYFLLWVGIALQINACFFFATGHPQWGAALAGFGASFAVTGFIGSLIYNPRANIEW